MKEGLMDDTGYQFEECEDVVCGHCGNENCIWYDEFLDKEDGE